MADVHTSIEEETEVLHAHHQAGVGVMFLRGPQHLRVYDWHGGGGGRG